MDAKQKKPQFDVGAIDQASKLITSSVIPHYAAVLRAFKAEEGVTDAEALILTVTLMGQKSG